MSGKILNFCLPSLVILLAVRPTRATSTKFLLKSRFSRLHSSLSLDRSLLRFSELEDNSSRLSLKRHHTTTSTRIQSSETVTTMILLLLLLTPTSSVRIDKTLSLLSSASRRNLNHQVFSIPSLPSKIDYFSSNIHSVEIL